jgi:hypothetical protein
LSKDLAKESEKTKRARQKLKKQLDRIDSQITSQAIEKKSVEIHRWISRHAPSRTILRTKNISLFDENKNTAGVSNRVEKLAVSMKNDFQNT